MAYDITNTSSQDIAIDSFTTIPAGATKYGYTGAYPTLSPELMAKLAIVWKTGTPQGASALDPEDVAVANHLGAAQNVVTLAFSATPAIDLSLGNYFKMTATAGATFAAPTNAKAGQIFTIEVVQDATGGHAIAFNAAYLFPVAFTNTGNTSNKSTFVTFRMNAAGDKAVSVSSAANVWI